MIALLVILLVTVPATWFGCWWLDNVAAPRWNHEPTRKRK